MMIYLVEILRGDEQQRIQVDAVGGQSPDGFNFKKLSNVETISKLFYGCHVFDAVLVLLVNIGISKISSVDTKIQGFFVIAIVAGDVIGRVKITAIVFLS